MKMVVAICPTFRRPKLIPNVIAMWNLQDYDPQGRHLVILDDGQSFDEQNGDNWSIITVPDRFETLGLKFRYLCDFATSRFMDADGIVVWEDDDVYLPHHVTAACETLKKYDVCCPSVVLSDDGGKGLHESPAIGRHHGAWSFQADAYQKSGGYPTEPLPPFDFRLLQRFGNAKCSIGDPIESYPISYIYRWMTTGYKNGSSFGKFIHERTANTHPESKHYGLVIPKLDDLTVKYFEETGHGEINRLTHTS